MATDVERINALKGFPIIHLLFGFPISFPPVILLVMLYFCQAWVNIAGFTVRFEDFLIIVFWGWIALGAFVNGRLRYYRHALNLPLLMWCGVLFFGVGITLISPYNAIYQCILLGYIIIRGN